MTELNTILSNEGTTVENKEAVATTAEIAPVQPITPVVVENATAQTIRDLLADEFKEVKSLQNFKDVNDLAKSYLNLNGLLGKKINEWAKEDIQGFLGKMGRPEKAEDYIIPEELERTSGDFKNLAHKAGLSQEQIKALADEVILNNRAQAEVATKLMNENKAKAEEELKKTFGDAYEKRIKIAERTIKELGGDQLLNAINESGLGANADVIKAFSKIGVDFLQADRVVHSDKSSSFGITPSEAQTIIDQRMKDPEFRASYHTRSHPNHAIAVKEMSELFEKLGRK